MAANRPAWVIKDLSAVLGLDSDSIAQLVLPDLETYNNETRLKSHLQDFLGPSAQAKGFIDRYTAHRFPRLPSQPAPVPPGPPKSLFSQPAHYAGSSAVARGASTTASGDHTPNAPTGKNNGHNDASLQDALETAFGPGGKVYQKNRDADDAAFGSSSAVAASSSSRLHPAHSQSGAQPSHHPAGAHGSNGGSGSNTPSQHMRRAGAMTITDARGKSSSGPGAGSERYSQKGKQRKAEEDKIWDHPKSKATLKLEGLLGDLKKMQDGEGGKVARSKEGSEQDCFCQVRLHPLSNYTPSCPSCGLTLCLLHPPTAPCPSCHHSLLSPAALSRLIMRVEDDIAAQLGREQDARDAIARRRRMAAQAEAAFPSLSGPGNGASGSGTSMSHLLGKKEEGRKVLTIGAAGSGKGKGKAKSRVTLTTTAAAAAASSSAAAEEQLELDDPNDLSLYSKGVVPQPRTAPLEQARIAKELAKHLKWRQDEDRPWGDMKAAKRGEVWTYVELPLAVAYEGGGGGRRKKKGEKGQGVDGRNVPGAKAVLG